MGIFGDIQTGDQDVLLIGFHIFGIRQLITAVILPVGDMLQQVEFLSQFGGECHRAVQGFGINIFRCGETGHGDQQHQQEQHPCAKIDVFHSMGPP